MPYDSELRFLDSYCKKNKIIVRDATTMPLSFCLAKNRKVVSVFSTLKNYYMFAAFETERDRFIKNLKQMIPFEKDLLHFALNNETVSDPWKLALLQYYICYFSTSIGSYDGPFSDLEFTKLNKTLSKLLSFPARNLDCQFESTNINDGINIYEFPHNNNFLSNSVIITNRDILNGKLLFEDKLKIYGV